MTGNTISKIAQQIAQKTGGNAVQIEKEMEKKILTAVNSVSDSKKYTIDEIDTMLISPRAKNQMLCLKKRFIKDSTSMRGGNGAELVSICVMGIVGIVCVVIFLANASNEEAFLLGAIMASGGGKRKTRKRSRKTRKKRRKNSKKKRN